MLSLVFLRRISKAFLFSSDASRVILMLMASLKGFLKLIIAEESRLRAPLIVCMSNLVGGIPCPNAK